MSKTSKGFGLFKSLYKNVDVDVAQRAAQQQTATQADTDRLRQLEPGAVQETKELREG